MGIKTVNSNIPYNLSLIATKFLPIFGGGAIIMCNFYISITWGWIHTLWNITPYEMTITFNNYTK